MIAGIWGKKIGMTGLFVEDKVVPVTVIDVSQWYILQIKTAEVDGYNAVKLGWLRDKYAGVTEVEAQWIAAAKKYFGAVKEVKLAQIPSGEEALVIGKPAAFLPFFEEGATVDVMGTTKGCGFAGVIKRHNFSGGPSSHGGKSTRRRPGSIGFLCTQGKVIKGKKMAGRMGGNRKTIKGLKVVKRDDAAHAVFVKGAVPGKSGSLVFIHKRG